MAAKKTPAAATTASPTKPAASANAEAFDAAACWERIRRWFAEHHPQLDLKLRPAANEKQIAALEKQIDRRLPEDFRASLLVHDGQDDQPRVFLWPFSERLGSLKSMAVCWKGDRPSYDKKDSEGRFEWLDDSERVRQVHFHPKHIAFAGTSYWDLGRLLFDFVPGPAGTEGQIIARADVDFRFLASSFAALLERTASGLEQGTIVVTPWGYGMSRAEYRSEDGVVVSAYDYFA